MVCALELGAPGAGGCRVVVGMPEQGVPGVVRQLVLDGGSFVAGSSWPWRKDPEILKALKVLQSREEGGICQQVMEVVRKAPSPQSCCS